MAFGPNFQRMANFIDPQGFFSQDEDPSKEANKYLDQIPEAMRPYFEKYINSGNKNLGDLNSLYDQSTNDPSGVINKIGGGYKESPGYQFRLHNALTAGTNAAAAGGMAGSPQHQFQGMETANNMAGEDYDKYMTNALNQYNNGVSGKSHLNDQGFDASKSFGEHLGSLLGTKAQIGYNQAQNVNNTNSAERNQAMQLIMQMLAGGGG